MYSSLVFVCRVYMCKCDFTCAATIQSLLNASKQIINLLTHEKGEVRKEQKISEYISCALRFCTLVRYIIDYI
jgi:hypothetical protein